MAVSMPRVIVTDKGGGYLFDLAPSEVFGLVMTEELGGEHALEVTTTRQLERWQRILVRDATGRWREWVVRGVDDRHVGGSVPVGTYRATWSLESDLAGSVVSAMPGTQSPVSARVALESVLSGTSRWTVGTVTVTTTGGASMYQRSAWEAMGVLVETWGGEVDATITVTSDLQVSRSVDLLAHLGQSTATRRFDWGADLSGISRTLPDEPLFCRIIPRGKGEETDSGGYGRKIGIESVNGGTPWLQDDEVAASLRLPVSGGWEYPTRYVDNSDIDDPQALKDWGLSVLHDFTRPVPTYEADVTQLALAGMDATGIALGDEVQCVDRGFCPGGLRVQGRVVRLVTDLLDPSATEVTIGRAAEPLTDAFASISSSTERIRETVEAMNGGNLSTASYLSRLIERMNAEANATGGYTYITEGQGIRTYDRAVSDPLVGSEASAVVEVKGGTVRIANSKTSGGEWQWKTVFTSGHVAAEVVTAAQLTTGYIGASSSGNFWNLDTGDFRMVQADAFSALTDGGTLPGLYMEGGQLKINGSYIQAGTISANRIDAAQLIAGKFGNSVDEYAEIGDTTVGGTSTGIVFYEDDEASFSVTRGATGLFVAMSDPNGILWPVITITDSALIIQAPPGVNGTSTLALSLSASGLTMSHNGNVVRVASF